MRWMSSMTCTSHHWHQTFIQFVNFCVSHAVGNKKQRPIVACTAPLTRVKQSVNHSDIDAQDLAAS